MITLYEINAGLSTENVLNATKTFVNLQVKEYLKQKAQALVTDALWSALRAFLPVDNSLSQITTQILNQATNKNKGLEFEDALKGLICDLFGRALPPNFTDKLWLYPLVGDSTGNAYQPGIHCPASQEPDYKNITLATEAKTRPDFIISPDRPREKRNSSRGYSWLIGDVKYSLKTFAQQYAGVDGKGPYNQEQFSAIANHAKNHGTHLAGFIALEHGKASDAQRYIASLEREAIKHQVAALVLTVFNGGPT